MAASAADPASDRIFKGYIADPHDFPWMVKLKVGTFKWEGGNGDGGTNTCMHLGGEL